jgi:hypothetical protein
MRGMIRAGPSVMVILLGFLLASCSAKEAAPSIAEGAWIKSWTIPGAEPPRTGPWLVEEVKGTRARLVRFYQPSNPPIQPDDPKAVKTEHGLLDFRDPPPPRVAEQRWVDFAHVVEYVIQ